MLRKKLSISTAPGRNPEPVVYGAALSHCQQLASAGNQPMVVFFASQIVAALPGELAPQLLLLSAYIQLMHMEQAEALAEQLLQQFPRSDRVYKTVADFHIAMGKPELAMPLLLKAVELQPGDASHYNALGHLHLTLGESEKALKALNKAVAIKPTYAGAHWNRAQILKTESGAETIALLEKLAASGKVDGRPLAMIYFSLAWCYGDADKAGHFHYLDKANGVMAAVLNADIDAEIGLLRSSVDFDGNHLKSLLSAQANLDEAPVFICAMPRSGTTLLERILGAHSQTCGVGETGALVSAVNKVGGQLGKSGQFWQWGNEQALSKALPLIDDLFRAHPLLRAADGCRLIDKSINNIVVAGLIPLLYPNARIVHLTRNPMAVGLSCYQLYFDYGQSFVYKLRDIARAYQLYDDIMSHWQEVYPDKVIRLSYESLVTDPETEIKRLLKFCDLPWEDQCLHYYEQKQAIKTASYDQASKPISTNAIDRWKAYAEYLQPVAQELGLD